MAMMTMMMIVMMIVMMMLSYNYQLSIVDLRKVQYLLQDKDRRRRGRLREVSPHNAHFGEVRERNVSLEGMKRRRVTDVREGNVRTSPPSCRRWKRVGPKGR